MFLGKQRLFCCGGEMFHIDQRVQREQNHAQTL